MAYPVNVEYQRPTRSSRWLAFATILFLVPKALMTLPHLLALYILGIVAVVSGILGQFAVLITGKYPKSLYELVGGVIRWQVRVNAFMFGLTDKYPPFQLHP